MKRVPEVPVSYTLNTMERYSLIYTNDLDMFLDRNNLELHYASYDGAIQLRNCQAWIIPCFYENKETGELKAGSLLQSYHTIVSLKIDNDCIRLGRWSTTTSRQQTCYERMA